MEPGQSSRIREVPRARHAFPTPPTQRPARFYVPEAPSPYDIPQGFPGQNGAGFDVPLHGNPSVFMNATETTHKAVVLALDLQTTCIDALRHVNVADSTIRKQLKVAERSLELLGPEFASQIRLSVLANDEEIGPIKDFVLGTLADIAATIKHLLYAARIRPGKGDDDTIPYLAILENQLTDIMANEDVSGIMLDTPEYFDNEDFEEVAKGCADEIIGFVLALRDLQPVFDMRARRGTEREQERERFRGRSPRRSHRSTSRDRGRPYGNPERDSTPEVLIERQHRRRPSPEHRENKGPFYGYEDKDSEENDVMNADQEHFIRFGRISRAQMQTRG
ncbi:hypothetical protein P154DRAFT_524444 [Amniculicola lignicola CBS 123094]|uniref:Uncharacterized protein n=1 Tax=Amniculicola lignicola CBS 123094 TaxID=1392246 RepID=A0A6A5WAH9_9PLEO|nr:hypothetical protein P154DRAFT_524444 [Amniculicola lignicola CBS 123094]